MATQNAATKKTLFSALDISEERGVFLKQKIDEIYTNSAFDNSNIVDVLHKSREHATNVNEDIVVCYLVGHLNGTYNERNNEIRSAIKEITNNIFGKR